MAQHNFFKAPPKRNRLVFGTLIALMVIFPLMPALAEPEISDRNITDAVQDQLLMDSATPSHLIDVTTVEGVVTLEGSVDNLLARERAARIAMIVKGVRSVVNNIRVTPSMLRSDTEIKRDVVNALLADPATESYEIDVSVENDAVTLKGKVQSWKERELSARVAKGVKGVTEVHNRIALDWPRKRSDDEIAAEVKRALKWDAFVDHALVDVGVDNGKVTLSGIVGSAAEKRRAYADAFVHGVKSVDDAGLEVQRWARDDDLRGEKYAKKSGEEIVDAVKDALLYDPRVSSFEVMPEITHEGNTVILRGTVDNLKAKRAAAQDARNTVGVVNVDNRIKVRPTEALSDEKIEADIRDAFMRDPYVEGFEIAVDVQNGVATLNGTVGTYFEKSQADDLASKTEGVIVVENNLVVQRSYEPYVFNPYVDYGYTYDFNWQRYNRTYPYRTDAQIERDIESEYFWSPFVDADQVTVEVEDGEATLTGTVDSWLEKGAARDNAYEGGAVFVDNDLIVSSY